jgi:hypothetical protein
MQVRESKVTGDLPADFGFTRTGQAANQDNPEIFHQLTD